VLEATYEAGWNAFAEAIRHDWELLPTLEDGRRARQIVLAAAHSLSAGTSVRVADAPVAVTPAAAAGVAT